jgi:hypothetical protein
MAVSKKLPENIQAGAVGAILSILIIIGAKYALRASGKDHLTKDF